MLAQLIFKFAREYWKIKKHTCCIYLVRFQMHYKRLQLKFFIFGGFEGEKNYINIILLLYFWMTLTEFVQRIQLWPRSEESSQSSSPAPRSRASSICCTSVPHVKSLHWLAHSMRRSCSAHCQLPPLPPG